MKILRRLPIGINLNHMQPIQSCCLSNKGGIDKMGYYLGIDLGTSSVRAILIKGEGNVVAVSSGEYPVHIPVSNWAEQDPNEWWTSTSSAIKEVIKKSS